MELRGTCNVSQGVVVRHRGRNTDISDGVVNLTANS